MLYFFQDHPPKIQQSIKISIINVDVGKHIWETKSGKLRVRHIGANPWILITGSVTLHKWYELNTGMTCSYFLLGTYVLKLMLPPWQWKKLLLIEETWSHDVRQIHRSPSWEFWDWNVYWMFPIRCWRIWSDKYLTGTLPKCGLDTI